MFRLVPLLALTLAAVATTRAIGCPSASLERYEPRSFLGYACEDDCQRQKAGFAWAENHHVTHPHRCGRLEPASAEGCLAYAEDRLTPKQAGYRWALENEVADPCLCDGAGADFRAGCLEGTAALGGTLGPAAPKRGRGAPSRFSL